LSLSDLALVSKDFRSARDLSQKSLKLLQSTDYVAGERVALLNLGLACIGLGEIDEAEQHLNACLLTAKRDKALTRALPRAHEQMADLVERHGQVEAALRHRLNAMMMYEKLELYDRAEVVRKRLGEVRPGKR